MPCDYKKYPSNWFSEIRPRILARAGHKCEFCGVQNHTIHPKTLAWVVLTIAHLDQDITNNADSNLAALCQRCHNRHDAPHRTRHAKTTRRRKKEERGQMVLL